MDGKKFKNTIRKTKKGIKLPDYKMIKVHKSENDENDAHQENNK